MINKFFDFIYEDVGDAIMKAVYYVVGLIFWSKR